MSDVRQKAKDLLKLATHEGTGENERSAATTQLLKLIEKYDLLSAGGVPIDVPASTLQTVLQSFLRTVSDPGFLENLANRAENLASQVERGMAVYDRVAGVSKSKTGRKRRIR
jgi:hypothetical protein